MKENIFQKNLNELSKNSPNIAKKVARISSISSEFALTESQLGDANLLWKNVLLHDDIDPIEEAQNIANSLKDNDNNSITILFGFGLGYVFKKIVQEVKGKVIVYEPDSELLRLVFDIVDFSEDLKKNTIAFVDNKNDLRLAFEKFFFIDSKVKFTFLNSYQALYPQELATAKYDSEFLSGLYTSNYRNFIKYANFWTHSAVSNFNCVLNNNNIFELKDKFKNKPAVIVSAGPSLDKTIDFLKDYRDNVVVFCVGTAMKTLAARGIKPDFLVFVEAHNCITEINGVDVSDVNLVLQPITHRIFHTLGTKRKFNFFQKNDIATKWLCDVLHIEQSEYESLGTVSFTAMVCAKIFGCNPIILIGQDLAYLEGNCYSKDAAFSNLKCLKNPQTKRYEVMPEDFETYAKSLYSDTSWDWQEMLKYARDRIKTINEGLLYVKSVNGEMIPTEAGYATFVSHFEDFAAKNKDKIKLINSSLGAYLEGFEHIPFDEALEKYCTEKIEVEEIVSSSTTKEPFTVAQRQLVKKKIDEQSTLIKKTLQYFEYGTNLCKKLQAKYDKNDFKSTSTKEIEKQILELIIGLEKNYIEDNNLYKSLIVPPYFSLKKDFILFDPLRDMQKMLPTVSEFFARAHNDLKSGADVLKRAGDELNESCNPKG